MAATANQYCALSENVSERHVDDVNSFEKEVNEAVNAALNSLVADSQPKPTKRNPKGRATATHEGAITGEVITLVIAALQPVLVQSVTAAVTTAVATASKQIMLDLRHDLGALHAMEADTKALRAQVQTLNFDIDRLQQYSRRENVRVFGIAEIADEKTNDIIVKVAGDMGVDITERDISVSHRIGKKMGTKPRPIIAKFVRRDTKTAIMRNKRNLKGLDGYMSVFVNDDLTTMRSKLVYELKRDESVTRVWTMNGKIMCIQEENGKEMKKVIDSPDDLFKVGWTEEKVAGLGFYSSQ